MRRLNHSSARQIRAIVKKQWDAIQADIANPPDRHVALEQIKAMMPDREEYYNWFNNVYELKKTSVEKYEKAIFDKLEDLIGADENKNSSGESTNKRYNNKRVPGKTCPKCNITLIVNEREVKTDDPENPYYERRLVCPNFTVNGCRYKEKWTLEIRAILDAEVLNEIDADF